MSETAAVKEQQWIEGRNGGKLLRGGTAVGPHRATTAVRRALIEALRDPRGGSGAEFFVKLKCGTSEDRRVFASVVTKLIPSEVQDGMGEALRVIITTLVAAPNGAPVPTHGTCVIGETAPNAPLPAPSGPDSPDAEAAT